MCFDGILAMIGQLAAEAEHSSASPVAQGEPSIVNKIAYAVLEVNTNRFGVFNLPFGSHGSHPLTYVTPVPGTAFHLGVVSETVFRHLGSILNP